MSFRASRKGKRAWASRHPTDWSDWAWDEGRKSWASYRLNKGGEYEYRYDEDSIQEQVAHTTFRSYRNDDDVSEVAQDLAAAGISSKVSGLGRVDEDEYQYPESRNIPTQKTSTDEQYQEHVTSSTPDFGDSKEAICPSCSMKFSGESDLNRHHKTVHLNDGGRPYQCLVEGCPADVRSWTTLSKLRLHEKNWHGPYSCSESGCSRGHPHGYNSWNDLVVHQREHVHSSGRKEKGETSNKGLDSTHDHLRNVLDAYPDPQPADTQQPLHYGYQFPDPQSEGLQYPIFSGHQPPDIQTDGTRPTLSPGSLHLRNIRTRNLKRTSDELDRRFRVHHSREFQFGRVFKILWSEPFGDAGTEITFSAAHGERAFHKVRRFIVIEPRGGHCLCIPILTYGYQGVLKPGVHAEDHGVAYSSSSEGPFLLEREFGLMSKDPIRVEVISAPHKLDPLSRINYSKVYTIEFNVKVFFIGEVARDCLRRLAANYNAAHPPVGVSLADLDDNEERNGGPSRTLATFPGDYSKATINSGDSET